MEYGFLRLDPASVLPSHIVFLVHEDEGMRVNRLHFMEASSLGTGAQPGEDRVVPASVWLREARASRSAELAEVRRLYPQFREGTPAGAMPESLAWDCPLRGVSFVSGTGGAAAEEEEGAALGSTFRPIVPSPVRTAAAYARTAGVNNSLGVHPIMAPRPSDPPSEFLTTNGRCLYEQPAAGPGGAAGAHWLRVPVDNTAEPCGPHDLLRSLLDGKHRASRVMADPSKKDYQCNDLVDWPDVNGTLRTGTYPLPRGLCSRSDRCNNPLGQVSTCLETQRGARPVRAAWHSALRRSSCGSGPTGTSCHPGTRTPGPRSGGVGTAVLGARRS